MKLRNPVELTDLRAMIHEAALDCGLWSDIVQRLSSFFRSARVKAAIMDGVERTMLVDVGSDGVDKVLDEKWARHYLTLDANPGLRFMASTAPITVKRREEIDDDDTLIKMDFYHDIMRPSKLWHGAMVNMHRDQRYTAPLGLLRTRSCGPITDSEFQMLQLIAPDFHRSVRSLIRIKELETLGRAATGALDQMRVGSIVTDHCCRVVLINNAAKAIVDEKDGLLIQGDTLTAASRSEAARLAKLVREACGLEDAEGVHQTGTLFISRPSERSRLPLVITPLGEAQWSHRKFASIQLVDPRHPLDRDTSVIRTLYELTPCQAAVGCLLARGCTPKEIARQLEVSTHTIRTHIRELFKRTHTQRLPELIRSMRNVPMPLNGLPRRSIVR